MNEIRLARYATNAHPTAANRCGNFAYRRMTAANRQRACTARSVIGVAELRRQDSAICTATKNYGATRRLPRPSAWHHLPRMFRRSAGVVCAEVRTYGAAAGLCSRDARARGHVRKVSDPPAASSSRRHSWPRSARAPVPPHLRCGNGGQPRCVLR